MAAVTIFRFLLWLKKSSWWSRLFRGDAAPCRSTTRGVLGSLWQGRLGSGHYISLLLSIARMLMLAISSFTGFTLWWGSSSRIDAALILWQCKPRDLWPVPALVLEPGPGRQHPLGCLHILISGIDTLSQISPPA
ncbi:uncharacterized protein K444DRAFT_330872 [Hyaloscypha bicolor E]|uniref:Uncharacterized protein n=1 Tax=Hyaloscypha bicolor E TaxID=1095630 RepID=A0A2J6TJR8_9HELO|nr:uncharacterized protein K444DRAFT_330872 [Hyaloscypha bicolor E]PMD63261.1 hypothetical protein K444DRAFT_330872 [Hyaloscypha bicolor E]